MAAIPMSQPRRPGRIAAIALTGVMFLGGCSGGIAGSTTPTSTTVVQAFEMPDAGPEVDHVEVLGTEDGRLLLAWTSRGTHGRDLWVSIVKDGSTGAPVRVATDATDVPLKELRPSLAAGPGELVAVAWTSLDMDAWVALSEDGGLTFHPHRLNLVANGMQVLPVIAFDDRGALHAVWIDPRDAPEHAEEPADLYMGVLAGDQYIESNLTERQTPSVCGCCRPHLEFSDDVPTVTFRNTSEDGYRDPYQLTPGANPTPVAPPTWQIEACPVAGPIAVDEEVVWFDGSTGQARILVSPGPESTPEVLLETRDGYRVTAGPRLVTGGGRNMILVPGTPSPRLLTADGGGWRVESVELASWASVAAVHQERLLVFGEDGGSLSYETHDLP